MKRLFISLLVGLFAWGVQAQVTTSPSPLTKSDLSGTITITFDPTAGNGGMKTATKCYCHTGLITDQSLNDGDWKNVIGSWRGATQPQLTQTQDGKWQLTIQDVYAFYGVPATTEILKIAFVFHDGPGGSKEGKTAAGGDIFVTISGVDQQVGIWRGFTPDACVEQARPAGLQNGITYGADGTSVTLCTYAASKTQPANHVFLVGDMTNWKLDNRYQLKRDGNYFWITLTGLQPGKEYRFQYAVERADGKHVQISDLYSEKLLHPDDKYEPKAVDPTLLSYPTTGADGGYVSVIQPGRNAFAHTWQHDNFVRPDKNNLVIYELWTYDYTPERSLAGLMNRLDYLQALGVNAVELMPVCEFDGNYNWGYSPNHYFALDKAYGSPAMFKAFVDECHGRGMAVIMDMVFNHATGLNPMNKLYPYGADLAENPWFNVTAPHSDNVYEDWNHGFQPAHEMFTRALRYWIEEYHVDGYRMDLSHGFCSNVAGTSVGNIKDYYTNGVQMASPGAYFILEHWGSNMGSERPQLINHGCLCWANTTNAYCQAAMGWLKDGDSFADANKDGYVSYAESHDEERMQYKAKMYGNGNLKQNESARLGRVAQNVAFNVLLNGSHMLWQYEEVGYDFSINSSIDQPAGTSSDNRCSKKPRPEPLGWFEAGTDRMAAYQACAKICQLRTRLMPSLFAGDPVAQSIGSGADIRFVEWNNGTDHVYVVANFHAIEPKTATIPSGTWYNYLNGNTTFTATSVRLQPGELLILTSRAVQPAIAIPTSFFGDDTAVDDLPVLVQPIKTIEDNQLVIILDGKKYDMYGRLIR